MTFLAPGFLWLGWLLIVPLILYLLPLPRRRLKTAALYLWERFLANEPFGKASEKMRRALGLALLAAVFVCLIFAAAEMALGSTAISARKVIVVMDLSAGMNAAPAGSGGKQTRLDLAKAAAEKLTESISGRSDVAVVESAGSMRTLAPFGGTIREAARDVAAIEPFDGDSQLATTLRQSYELWGNDPGTEVYVFTDRPLPPNPWANRAHPWIAPAAGDNVAVVQLDVQRKGSEIITRFTLANDGKQKRTLAGTLLCNGEVRGSFRDVVVESGQTAGQSIRIEEPGEAAIEVRIDGAGDALPADDAARAMVPSADALGVAVVWPDQINSEKPGESKRKNEYLSAALTALQGEGVIGPVLENATPAAGTVYVNCMPQVWPKGGAIVLYPLKSGAVPVAGVHQDSLTVTGQAADPLLTDVDLRGLVVKDALQCDVPAWAHPLVWAQGTPLVWAGETGGCKVMLVAIPPMLTDSRLPLVASFPALLRNGFQWMLPRVEMLRPGEASVMAATWTSRRAGFIKDSAGKKHAVSVLSARASNLVRTPAPDNETFTGRRSMATPLVFLAIVLLAFEWGLFHRRFTE